MRAYLLLYKKKLSAKQYFHGAIKKVIISTIKFKLNYEW